MLNWALRYAPVVAALDRPEMRSILDVGSGLHGISRYLHGPTAPQIVQTDLQVDHSAKACEVVLADAVRLPFQSAAFDAVLSLDLVEHLAAADRTAALGEMFRVARRCVIVGFPVAPGAEEADRQLALHLARRRRPLPPWLVEHQHNGYPTADLGRRPAPGWELLTQRPNDPLWLHTAVAKLEHQRLLGRVCSLPLPLMLARTMAKAKGDEYYRNISIFRRVGVEASRP